jgi:uncharacterized Zn-finger protein
MAYGPPSPSEMPPFFNEVGSSGIEIGVAAFGCMGGLPPDDHPQVYLNMGEQTSILCPYCATRYSLNPALSWKETIPDYRWVARA